MRMYHRLTPVLALAGALALGGSSTARAQDTSQVSGDTAAYQGYTGADTSAAAAPDTSGADSGAAGPDQPVVTGIAGEHVGRDVDAADAMPAARQRRRADECGGESGEYDDCLHDVSPLL